MAGVSVRTAVVLAFVALLSVVSTYQLMHKRTVVGGGGAVHKRPPPPSGSGSGGGRSKAGRRPASDTPAVTAFLSESETEGEGDGDGDDSDSGDDASAEVADAPAHIQFVPGSTLVPGNDEPLSAADAAQRMYTPDSDAATRAGAKAAAHSHAHATCSAAARAFPAGRQLLVVDDVTTEPDVEIIARVQHSQYTDEQSVAAAAATAAAAASGANAKAVTPVRASFAVPLDKFSPYCNLLDKRMWIECPASGAVSRSRASSRPCTRMSYVARHRCSFVDARTPPMPSPLGGEPGAVSAGPGVGRGASPGAVFDSWRQFHPMKHTHAVRTGESADPQIITTHKRLAHVLTSHFDKPNYFLRETLPRLLFLIANIPKDVPILIGAAPPSLLAALKNKGIDTDRFIQHTAKENAVYFAEELYYASEWPLCESENPNHLLKPTFSPKELLDPVRALFVPQRVPAADRQKVVVVRRNGEARRINIDPILDALKAKWPKMEVLMFDENFANSKPFEEHVSMFAQAKIIISAHGAGLANQMFSAPGTVVMEAGYDQCKDGCFDDVYYEMALALGHQYFTALGGGPHDEYQECCPCHLEVIFKDGGQTRDASNVKSRHSLNRVEPNELPPEIPDPVLAPYTYGGPAPQAGPKPPIKLPKPGGSGSGGSGNSGNREVERKPPQPQPPKGPRHGDTALGALPDCSGRDTFPLGKSLRSVTDIFGEKDITFVKTVEHDEYGKISVWGSPNGKFEQYCGILDKRVWIECPTDAGSRSRRAQARPCTKRSYIPKHECAWIDSASVNQFVPGTVFDQNRMFMPLKYVRPAKTDYKSASAVSIVRFERLAHVLSPYPGAPGHYPHEVLPRLVWLHQTLPADVKLLVPVVHKYIDALVARGVLDLKRIVPYENGKVYFANEIYYANEWPFCEQPDNPHQGGEPTFYPQFIMENLRKAFVGNGLPESERQTTVVIARKAGGSRSLVNHDEVVNALEANFPDSNVVVFDDAYVKRPYEDHIKLFQSAKIIIAPHGAGLSNIMYAAPGTVVIEVAFDKCDVMCIDEMYYQLAASLGHDYWLLVAAGTYTSPMQLHVPHLINLFENGGSKGPGTENIKPKHNPNVVLSEAAAKAKAVAARAQPKCDSTFPLNAPLRQVKDIVAEIEAHPNDGIELLHKMEHKWYGKLPLFGTPQGKWQSTCDRLERRVWIECPDPNAGQRAPTRPCTKMSYIAKHRCAWIDNASVHGSVPGTVFDRTRCFTPLKYVRPAKTDYGAMANIPKVLKFKKLAHVLTPYPGAAGHYPHEVLPRLLYLHQNLPKDVKIVVPFVHKYLELLIARGELNSKQLVAHEDGTVYFAEELYYANEWPFCEQNNPHQGGEPTFYPTEIMEGLRRAFTGQGLPRNQRQSTVIIKRSGSRELTNHNDLVNALKSEFPRIQLEVFDNDFAHNKPFEEHVKLFSGAKVIIAPHGAGESNIMYAQPGTVVIEIGFDQCDGMCNDEMYYQLAQSLGQDYWMVLSPGSYGGRITVNVADVISILKTGGSRGDKFEKAAQNPNVDA